MASPFRYFRKNQKVMLAVIGIISMFAFVFIGPWSGMGRSSAAANADPDVFTWKFGSVKTREVNDRLRLRRAVNLFLKNSGMLAGTPPQLIMQNLFSPETEQGIVYQMLLQKKAQELGITVTDGMVNRFIGDITNDKLTPDQLRGILRSQSGLSQGELFEGLRRELEAKYADMAYSPLFARYRQMGGMPFFVFTGDTPSDRWDYFLRLNREVTTELMPVKVADFVSQIADPTAEQIRSFYEQYKNDYPYYNQFPWPELPTPGFKQPFKAQFQYVKSNYEKRMAEEQPKITEQEIADYYEKFKDTRFKKAKLPELPGKKPGEELEKPAGEPTDQPPATDAKGADSKSGEKSAEKKTETTPADGSTKGQKSDSKSGAAKTDSKSGAKSSAGKSDAKPSGSKDSKAKSTDGKQSSLTPPKSLDGELLAMADEAAPIAKLPAPDTKSSDNKASDTQAPDTKTPDTQAPSAQPPVEYEPLEKVSDTIRKDLARQRIEERAGAQFGLIEGMLDDYRIKLERYRANVTTNKNAKKPEPPSLAELLEKANATDLEGKQTDPISDRQAYNDTDVGKSRKMISAGNYETPSFLQLAYNPALKFYKADRSDDNDNNQYLWWKTADEPAHVPTLDEIKPEVIQAWKMIQARKPAMAKAEENAAQARKLNQTLKDTFGDNAGISTVGPFSWYTRSVSQPFGPAKRTEVAGVDQGGDPFLKAVFALSQGQTGVAPNEPQTIYYVVQIESEKPPLDELHQQFMVAMSSPYTALTYAGIGWQENQGLGFAWAKELENEYDFKMIPGHQTSEPVNDSSSDD
jgi:SurA N-terminal domain